MTTIREWARDAGYEVGDRGLIPGHIIEAYKASEGLGDEPVAVLFEPVVDPIDPVAKPLTEWLELRDELEEIITIGGGSATAAERILLAGWTRPDRR